MRGLAATLLVCLIAAPAAGVAAEGEQSGLPDPDYCALRDADPRKCTLNDGIPPRRALAPLEAAVMPPQAAIPNPSYCSRRDADPAKCVIQDGPPPVPYVRRQAPSTATVPVPASPSVVPVPSASSTGASSRPPAQQPAR
jgi:hypothetical protein